MPILAVVSPTFQPAMRIITNISNSNPCVITTSFANEYVTGLIVRLYVPQGYGITILNHVEEAITVLTTTSFSMPIDSSNMAAFIVPLPPLNDQYPQVVPTGEINSILYAATRNVL
jgi:hypothetical protein